LRSRPRLRTVASLAAAVVALTGGLGALATPAFAASTAFTTGDLVIYEVQGTSSSASPVSLVDYSTGGVPSGYSVPLPSADSGTTHSLVESGSALNDGELTDSADGQSLIATGYDDPVGTASITGTTVARTVDIVGAAGTVDATTALTSPAAIGTNNFRSATTAVTGGPIYTGSGAGPGVATDGTATDTLLDTTDKVHDIQVVNGQLYESTTKNILSVGTGLPTAAGQTSTGLLSGANLPANFGPDQFALVTLGGGATPDTLYVADGSNGATAGDPSAVEKYSLKGGVWTAEGSIAVPLAMGLAVSVTNGVANLYVTGAVAGTGSGQGINAPYNSVLYGITDSSGAGGTLSGTATALATAPAGDAFKGVAFAPQPAPGTDLPETPLTLALPVVGALSAAAYVVLARRRHAR
jgi:hypothetical protein